MSRKIVVALGGNAILSSDPSAQAQQEALVETAKHLVKLIKNGDELIITHGNGPQVGNLLLQHLAANSEKNPAFPLDSLVAMTEGSIGYWLQNALQNALLEEGIEKLRALTRCVYNAPTVMMIGYEESEQYVNEMEEGIVSGQQDASIVATHMMLEATELGIGSVWVDGFPNTKNPFEILIASSGTP